LGLAFCKELVNFMDGDITVNSKINEGSQFIVTLPYEAVE
jgi:two-component system phosphate regulon sensor histidine kinase PhoR